MSTPAIAREDWLEAPRGLSPAVGGVTAPDGFRAGGAACGVKPSGALDVAVLVSDRACASALADTTSALPSAAVQRNRELDPTAIQAVVVNAGTANAATGSPGLEDARAMADLAAGRLSLPPERVAVCSTGTIGDRLDMPRIAAGIERATAGLRRDSDDAGFALAIQTTDRTEKRAAFRLRLQDGEEVTIGLAAKGAGMIRPGMATMLAFVTTDVALAPEDVATMTRRAAAEGFNRISVDAQMSPSDTLIVMANGAGEPLAGADRDLLGDALRSACRWAAIQMVKDGEGAEHAVRLRVRGAASAAEADAVARAVGESPLVKTAVFGRDPNWGRLEQAVGQALAGRGGPPAHVSAWLDGAPIASAAAADAMARPEYDLDVSLGRGEGDAELFFCDLTHGYVSLNAEYRT